MEEVKTRAHALAMAKRKMMTRGNDQLDLATSAVVQLKRCSGEEEAAETAMSADDLDGRVSDHVLEGSCCSSNCSQQERIQNIDQAYKIQGESVEQVEAIASNFDYGYRSEETNRTDHMSSQPENNSPPPEQKAPPKVSSEQNNVLAKSPPADEIEEFFATREKMLHKKYREKYNFDFENEVPLEGRYNWVAMKRAKSS